MKWFDNIALTLVIIGAINWLLVGIFRFDLVAFLFGNLTWISRIIYTLVGLCGLYLISLFGRIGTSPIPVHKSRGAARKNGFPSFYLQLFLLKVCFLYSNEGI